MRPILGFRNNKQCPLCAYILTRHTPQCWACGYRFPSTPTIVGAPLGKDDTAISLQSEAAAYATVAEPA